jgi:hypothetical protein
LRRPPRPRSARRGPGPHLHRQDGVGRRSKARWELYIHDVFQLLDLGRKTGILRVTSELRQNAGVVYFDGGAVVAAEIRTNPHPLGALLLRAGKVSEEELARAVAVRASRDGQRLGDVLVAMGALTRRELDRQIRVQVEEVIRVDELVRRVLLRGRKHPRRALRRHRPNSHRVAASEAARRIDEWSRIEARSRTWVSSRAHRLTG